MIADAEVIHLRRIALLVSRASEDCDPIRDDLVKIATIIDQMKRSIVLGSPLDRDVARLSSLIRRLPANQRCDNPSCDRLRTSLIDELRELMPELQN